MHRSNRDIIAVTEMNALQTSMFLAERKDGVVGEVGETHEPDTAQLGERGELEDGEVCELRAVREIDVSDAGARLDEPRHASVGDAVKEDQLSTNKR